MYSRKRQTRNTPPTPREVYRTYAFVATFFVMSNAITSLERVRKQASGGHFEPTSGRGPTAGARGGNYGGPRSVHCFTSRHRWLLNHSLPEKRKAVTRAWRYWQAAAAASHACRTRGPLFNGAAVEVEAARACSQKKARRSSHFARAARALSQHDLRGDSLPPRCVPAVRQHS